jgi:sn-glycerol 3-phosphate transport system ATP-binding protein
MSAIELSGVTKAWGDTVAVDDVSFVVDEGTFAVLLGPSGCGKSTTLRLIAGLEQVTGGTVRIAGEDMTGKPPSERRISMVFQSYALFPHLDVAENIVFGLRVRKTAPAERRRRLEKVAEIVGLAELLHRKPAQLSGGQRQRVALARAIIAENPICLMDEPLSNLDAKLRHDMRGEIRGLQQRLGMTVVYVTHDQSEAMSMADKVILLRDGRIEQSGTPDVLYDRPETEFAAGFIGTPPMNLLDLADGAEGAVLAGLRRPALLDGPGAGLKLGIRPEHVEIRDSVGIPVELVWSDYLGADTIVTARLGGQSINVRAPGRFHTRAGQQVRLAWAPENVHVFDAATGRRIDDSRPLAMAA